MHADLNLSADAHRGWEGLPCGIRLLHVLRRDLRAHAWDYSVVTAMVGIATLVLATRIDVEDADPHRFNPDTVWTWVFTIAVCAGLIGRRRWPLRSLAVSLVLILPLELAKQRDNVAFFALVIALYSVAAYSPLRRAWRGVLMVSGLYAALVAVGTTTLAAAPQIGNIMFASAFALGLMIRRSRTWQERVVDAAVRRSTDAAEIAELRAADERLRMAQELHDIVAHSLSVIAVQAGIGVHLIDRQPAEAALALEAIRTTSHTAEGELTRLVDILRDGGSVESAPSLDGLTALIDETRAVGVSITNTTSGDLHTVPAGVSLAAFRIVQEALTNVVRHAGRAQVTVTIQAADNQLDLCIDDDGHGVTADLDTAAQAGGHGLVGMSERAAMYGGHVRCGARPGGGFRVQATLPYFASPITRSPSVISPVASTTADSHPSRRALAPWMWDISLAALMAAVATVEIIAAGPTTIAFTPTHLWAWTLRIGCCLTLAVRRRYPTASYAAVWALGLALTVGDYRVGVIVFTLWIGLYTVASYATRGRFVGALVGTYAGMVVLVWSKPPDLTTAGAVWVSVFFTGAAVAGWVARRDRDRRISELAEREIVADTQSRRTRLVITTERLRIADELNTIITRSIHTIAEQAGTGYHMVDSDPITTRDALKQISATSRDALNDLRRLLKRLRSETEPVVYEPLIPSVEPVAAGEPR